MKCQGVVAAAFLGAVCAQLDSLPPCGITCVNNVIAKGFGCASGDNACLCKQQDFVFGIRDCAAQSCAAAETAKVNDYVTGLCATATKAPPSSTPPASSPTPSAPAQQQTTPPPPPSSNSLPPSPLASTAASNQASAPNPPASSAATSAAPSEPPHKSTTEAAQATQLPTTAPTTLFDHVGLYWNPAVAIWFFPKRWGRESN
ncbi:GPI-anchored CFEM domain protein [Colletotrichum higginsianum]|uniref:GPI-anchored CFEM domain protein n=2 Tax=Colletotrichum higginsianum TaxID=80884 RepID=A0A4T0VHU9_9PEZI|nr:GPI-anchored CFEM domain protein [Colletotrichum higginsianum]